MISVIVPTVKGREPWLAACVAAYEATCPDLDLIVVHNDGKPCGQGWIDGAERATGDYLHFTADDLLPFPGWWEAAVAVADADGIPGANVLTAKDPEGEWLEATTMYAGAFLYGDVPARNILVPFFTRKMLDAAEWLLPIHYGSDDWVTFLADRLDIPMPFTPGYVLGHGAAPEGRLHTNGRIGIPLLCDKMAEFGEVPRPYQQMGFEHGWIPKELAA